VKCRKHGKQEHAEIDGKERLIINTLAELFWDYTLSNKSLDNTFIRNTCTSLPSRQAIPMATIPCKQVDYSLNTFVMTIEVVDL